MPPIYLYRCPNCGDTKTELLSMANRDNIDHVPRCGPAPYHPFRAAVVMQRVQTAVAGIVRNPAVARSRRA